MNESLRRAVVAVCTALTALTPAVATAATNMSVADARRLWKTLKIGDTVYVWGHKPGT